jgi:hypothetical protein
MKDLRKLTAVVVLMCVLGLPAFAGEVLTAPCPVPEPGEVLTPPCGAAPGDLGTSAETSTSLGDMGTTTSANDETLFTKIAGDVLLNLLPLF